MLKTYQYLYRLTRFSLKYFVADISTATVFWLSFTVLGLILRAFFNYLTGEPGYALPVWPVVGLQIGYALVSATAMAAAILANTAFRHQSIALLVRNMFARILDLPGAQPLPVKEDGVRMSAGEVVSTFRDDTNEIVNTVTLLEDTLGMGIAAAVAAVIMVSINPWVTLGAFAPLGLIVYIAYRLGPRVERYRKESRAATSQVTGVIADMFNGTQALKVANAEDRIVAHFQGVNDRRRGAMVKDKLVTELVNVLSWGTIDLGLGLILLLAARLMYAGEFTIGDFALFVANLFPMTQAMRMAGWMFASYRQARVSFVRMEDMMQGAPAGGPVAHNPVYLFGDFPPVPVIEKTAADRLERLEVAGLTYRYEGEAGGGVEDVSFEVPTGSFTVITGRIGSGKTTLLKALLGLLPAQGGEVRWNGVPVADPARFFAPPRCAYTGQVPRLFSASVRDNILLGVPDNRADLAGAVRSAVLEKDVFEMEQGLGTEVGPKGVRLSGGQVQRTAAARMFVRDAELMVFDDLSSALDVETERQLWEGVFADREAGPAPDGEMSGSLGAKKDSAAGGKAPTCLVVSHRRSVLRRADQILLLKEGRLIGKGKLEELLAENSEMRALWKGDAE